MNRRVRDPYARWCERRTPVVRSRSRLLDQVSIILFEPLLGFSNILKFLVADPSVKPDCRGEESVFS